MKQSNGIPMGIDTASFWENHFLCSFEGKYITSLISSDKIRARYFHSAMHFTDNRCLINDGGEFERSICNIYPEFELKIEHQSDHATFLNLDITIRKGTFIHRLFDKRDLFPFLILRMPYIESMIPQKIFFTQQSKVSF